MSQSAYVERYEVTLVSGHEMMATLTVEAPSRGRAITEAVRLAELEHPDRTFVMLDARRIG